MPLSLGSLKKIYYGWVVVLAVFLISATVWGVQYSFGVFFTQFQDSYNWSRAAISLASTVQTIIYSFLMIPAIRAIDHYNERLILSSAAFLFGIGVALCGKISNLWQLYLYFGLIAGAGCGIFFPALSTVVSRWFTGRRGLALGIASAGVGVGTFAIPPIAQYLVSEFGWRDAFTILGIACFIILIVCVQFIKREPSQDSELKKPKAEQKYYGKNTQAEIKSMPVAQIIKTNEIYLILAATVFVFFAVNSVMVHLVPHIKDISASALAGAFALSVIGVSGTIGRIFMGIVQDRIGAKRAMVITMTVLALAVILLPFIKVEAGFFVFALLFGFSYGGQMVQTLVLITDCYGSTNTGVIYAMVIMTGNILGTATGSYVTGYVYDITKSYTLIFVATGMACLLGMFLITRIKIRYSSNI